MNLQDIELIKQLKGKYFRFLDTNAWSDMAEIFVPDATATYSDGDHSFGSRDEIIDFLSGSMSGRQFLSMHTAHHPEITLTGDNTAEGIWYLHDIVYALKYNVQISGNGIYSDHYRKVDDHWRITHTGYQRIFEVHDTLGENFRVVKNNYKD
ncbi:MAG: nuclear transport factor 2 family protein [Halioglobus sp.]|nr:nuclear transport factor 2 family protein [Halioglobus sp.]